MDYQWYPGHMTKTIRQMQENIKLIDLVIEIVDARIPLAARNPDIDSLCAGKARMILFGKTDLADESETEKWIAYYRKRGFYPYACDLRSNSSIKGMTPVIMDACREKIERNKRRGIMNRPVRAMVCGIPNVGKSTFINSFSGSSSLKTGNKPGVTKGRQWIRLNKQVELLDTPGLLWPRFENQEIGKKIALIGSIPDANTDVSELAFFLVGILKEQGCPSFAARYMSGSGAEAGQGSLTADFKELSFDEIMEIIGKKRGALRKGGGTDYDRAAAFLIDDFRSGRLGRITLEKCIEGTSDD